MSTATTINQIVGAQLGGTTALAQISNAQLGIAGPLAYGYVRARGDNILLQQITGSSNNRVALYILGEGEWDGIERLWIGEKQVNIGDPGLVHFHGGQDGALGNGLAPNSNGPDQNADRFFSSIPANFQPLAFSRWAYLALNVPPDPAAPSATLDVVGDYRACKVRVFDVNGNQAGYRFSTNGAWQALDLILRVMLKPDWNPSAAAASGGDLTAAEKARIDFPSVVNAAAWCDQLLSNGNKRFESSVAWTTTVKMQQALAQLLVMSQLFVHEAVGKIYIRADQPRASTFLLTADHVVGGTEDFDKVDLHGAVNRFTGTWNEVNPADQADIQTPANNGLVRAGNIVTVTCKGQHPFLANDNVQIVNPDDPGFAGVFPVATVPSASTFTFAQAGANATSGDGYCGTPESRFAQSSANVDHLRHQNAMGQRGLNLGAGFRKLPLGIDLGNNIAERANRILNFLKNRNLGIDALPYRAPWTCKIGALAGAVDPAQNALIAQLVGDIVTIDPTVSEEFSGDYEIVQRTVNLPANHGSSSGSGGGGASSAQGAAIDATNDATIDLKLLQYLPAAFSDASFTPAPLTSSMVRPVPLSLISDNLVRNGDFSSGAINWQISPVFGGGQFSGPQFLSAIAGLPRGGAEFRVPSTVVGVPLESVEFIPVDGATTYFCECWLKIGAPLAGGLLCFGGFIEYDLNQKFIAHTSGGFFAGFCLFAGIVSTTANGWQYFAVEVSGNGGSNPAVNQFNANAKYVRMFFLLNWAAGGTPQIVELQAVRWSEVAAGNNRAINGLQTSGQLAGSFKNNPVNTNGALTGSNPLSQSGASTTINVSACGVRFGDGVVNYNSGSVNPGSYGTWAIYCIDPAFAGGAVVYRATQNNNTLTSTNGVVLLGMITTASAGGASGTGGGTGAGGGGRGSLLP